MLFNAPQAALAVLSILGSVSASRLNDYAKRGGYGAHVEGNLQKRADEDCPPGKNSTFRFLTKETER
jgi:hypothetical protein